MAPESSELEARIFNAAWMVRHYARGARSGIQKMRRQQAIQNLGLTVRDAFNATDDFERLLVAIVDGLRPRDEPPF